MSTRIRGSGISRNELNNPIVALDQDDRLLQGSDDTMLNVVEVVVSKSDMKINEKPVVGWKGCGGSRVVNICSSEDPKGNFIEQQTASG